MRRLLLCVLFFVFSFMPPAFADSGHRADDPAFKFVTHVLDTLYGNLPTASHPASRCGHCGKRILVSVSPQDPIAVSVVTGSHIAAVDRDNPGGPAFAFQPPGTSAGIKPATLSIVTTHHDPPLQC